MGADAPAQQPSAAEILATYVAGIRPADLTPPVTRVARLCLIDAVACAIHGSRLPWSRVLADYVGSVAGEGPCSLPAALGRGLPAPQAALCLGAFAHAFELDCLRKPGAGVHPGATVALPALMVGQSLGSSGREVLAAIIAGSEVMFRIGNATLHTPESLGFHAPGITGPFGAAAAAGRLLGLSADQLANAFGLAGSFAGGLLSFAKAREGGMVKRLHLGRAAEAGVMAALLARNGFEAPKPILEGRFGVLDAFCEHSDATLLTKGLGEDYEIERLCIKRYACHVTAQAPVQLLREVMTEYGLEGDAIEGLTLTVSDKVLSHHSEQRPADLMLAQYSVPFSVATAAYRDPEDPASFSDEILQDKAILSLSERIELRAGRPKGWGVGLALRLRDRREISREADSFLGCPDHPFSDADIERKFTRLTAQEHASRMKALLATLNNFEAIADCSVGLRQVSG
jgi:2-methylcitrate dehydratase PrpD